MSEQETHQCPKCEDELPVTDDFWYRFGHGKELNLSICKKCHSTYYKKRNAKITVERAKRLRPKSEFDGFCKSALADQVRRIRESEKPKESIYQEIS